LFELALLHRRASWFTGFAAQRKLRLANGVVVARAENQVDFSAQVRFSEIRRRDLAAGGRFGALRLQLVEDDR
jgi:hypothetical protein